jgi:hypothetical protein
MTTADRDGQRELHGRSALLRPGELFLDPGNPRLRSDREDYDDQTAIAKLIARQFRAIELAESIAENDYFQSEPLIAVDEGSTWRTAGKPARYRVVEGNRRADW